MRFTIPLPEPLGQRLMDAAGQQGVCVSTTLREAVTSYLDGIGSPTPTPQLVADGPLGEALARVIGGLQRQDQGLGRPDIRRLVSRVAGLLQRWEAA